jgi:hypothetical protein
MIKHCIAAVLLVLCTSCGTLSSGPSDSVRLVVIFGTMKTIEESERISADGVLRYVDYAREAINLNLAISATDLALEMINRLVGENMSDADRFLVSELTQNIAGMVEDYNVKLPETPIAVSQVVDWFEQAALMKGGRRP